jgi:hypothetical protein
MSSRPIRHTGATTERVRSSRTGPVEDHAAIAQRSVRVRGNHDVIKQVDVQQTGGG